MKVTNGYVVCVVATKMGRNRAVMGITSPDSTLDKGDESMKNREGFQMGVRIYL